jgi:hypothetical protein
VVTRAGEATVGLSGVGVGATAPRGGSGARRSPGSPALREAARAGAGPPGVALGPRLPWRRSARVGGARRGRGSRGWGVGGVAPGGARGGRSPGRLRSGPAASPAPGPPDRADRRRASAAATGARRVAGALAAAPA